MLLGNLLIDLRLKYMNLQSKINNIIQASTSQSGYVDKELFQILAVMLGNELTGSEDDQAKYDLINKAISDTIGIGHSLISCGQFVEGKKGQSAIKRLALKLKQVV